MILEIQNEICEAIEELYLAAAKTNYIAYILLIARAEIQPGLKKICGTDCVTNYQMDIYLDETRTKYYLDYLKKNYSLEGYSYQSEDAVNDITAEMTIYSHIWDSDYFMKSLYRFAAIISGKGYLWKNVLPTQRIHEHFAQNVIDVFKKKGLKIGAILEKSYKSSIRNAFAHSHYNIDVENRQVHIRPRSGYESFSFDDFQKVFLYATILMNKMENYQEINHNRAAEKNTAITEVFLTPDNVNVQVYGRMVSRGDIMIHELHIVKVIED